MVAASPRLVEGQSPRSTVGEALNRRASPAAARKTEPEQAKGLREKKTAVMASEVIVAEGLEGTEIEIATAVPQTEGAEGKEIMAQAEGEGAEVALQPQKKLAGRARRTVFCLCAGTALMDFTSHIASQATIAYAFQLRGSPEAVARLLSSLTATGALLEFLVNPWLGRLSDTFGRRLPLLLCPAMNCVARAAPPCLGASQASLLFGRGVSGGMRASYFAAVKAAIADVVPEAQRTAALGNLGAFMQASFMVGMFSAGAMTKRYSPATAYVTSAAVSLAALALTFLGVSETLPAEERREFAAPQPFSCGDLLRGDSIYNKSTQGAGRKLAVVVGLQKGTGEPGLTDAKNMYNTAVLGWDVQQRGLFLATEGMAMMVASANTGRAVQLLGKRLNFFLGSVFKALQYIVMGLTRSGQAVYGVLPLALPLEATMSVDAALTNLADEVGCGQGRLAADVQNLQALLKIVFPIVYSWLFAWGHSRGLSGLPHFLYAGAWLVSMPIFASLPKKYHS